MERVEVTIPVVAATFDPLLAARQRVVVLEGSARSGKTWAIIQVLICRALEKPRRIFAGRHDGTTCDTSVIPDFQEVMQQMQVWDPGRWNKQRKRYEFGNGSVWEFGGTKDPQKVHGRGQDICWLNEAMEIPADTYTQLAIRTPEQIILDFNPSFSQHWVFSRVLTQAASEVLHIHSTYRDNPFLSRAQVEEIEKLEPTPENRARGTADPWKWQVYGLGMRGRPEGAVFKLYELTDDWPEALYCARAGYGLDFGFSADPAAVIECRVQNDLLYMRELVYETGLLTSRSVSDARVPSLEQRMEEAEVDRARKVYADSARPEGIRELQLAGYNVWPGHKAPDSVQAGISLLQGRRLMVFRGSHNLQIELENYTWDRRADGTWLDRPVDRFNHLLDGARYWALGELRGDRPGGSRRTQPRTALTRRVRA
ncbi:MAG: PBSX family phage terminase large subunit [Acholeplasmataceae bacterium]|jgi:phage terminase large subunit